MRKKACKIRRLSPQRPDVNNEVVEEMRKFNENLSKFHLNFSITKRIGTLERQCWANAQYSRKECVEVVGIPRQENGKHLEAKVLSIFQKVGCTIAPEFIDDCH